MKEIELTPNDRKSAERENQLQQVILLSLLRN